MAKLSRFSIFLILCLSICVILFNISSGKRHAEILTVSQRSIGEVLLDMGSDNAEGVADREDGGNATLIQEKVKVNCSNVEWNAQKGNEDTSWILCYTPDHPLACFHDPLHCRHHFHATTLRANERQDAMPKYGEYRDLAIEKWVLVLQHGGVVFLYHPCADDALVQELRVVAGSCLHQYIIAPSDHLNSSHPVAMVTWGCFYKSKNVDQVAFQTWIRKNAIKGPASYIPVNGKFVEGLIKCSEIVSDILDSNLCPNESQQVHKEEKELPKHDLAIKHLMNLLSDYHQPEGNRTMKEHQHSAGVFYKNDNVSIKIEWMQKGGSLRSKFDKGNAAWALGSIVFLCVVLIIGYVFGKPQKATYTWRNAMSMDLDQESLNDTGNNGFPTVRIDKGILKKSPRTKGQYRSLLQPIREDSDSDDHSQ